MSVSILDNTESVKDAAALIGVTDGRLRQWIRNYVRRCPTGKAKPKDNECRALKIKSEMFPAGYAWQVPTAEISRLKAAPRNGGRPRVGDANGGGGRTGKNG